MADAGLTRPLNGANGSADRDKNQVQRSLDTGHYDKDDDDVTCGVGSWRPRCLQPFANPTVFFILFSLIAIVHGSAYSYLVGSTTTLEKRYAYNSKMTGFILIADNLSAVVLSPIMGFFGRYFSRTRLMGGGMTLMAISCWMTSLPYFIYGPVKSWSSGHSTSMAINSINATTTMASNLSTSGQYQFCDALNDEQCEDNGSSLTIWPAYYILWIASFIDGIGYTAFYTLGVPYLDDNISKKDAPALFGLLGMIRLLGPSMGFVLTSACLNWYEDPFYDPGFGPKDPRWVGAWWIGYFIIGTALFFVSMPMFFFPGNLAPQRKRRKSIAPENVTSKAQDMKDTIKRLFTNPVFVFDAVGSLCRAVGLRGYYISQPKYIESQFRKTAAEASFLTGTTSMLAMAVGMFGGGLVVKWLKPGPRYLTSFILFTEVFANFAMIAGFFLKCPGSEFHGFDAASKTITLDSSCNAACDCSQRVLQPVCSSDGITNYFSPCFAGCSLNNSFTVNDTTYFSDCSCEADLGLGPTVTSGYCPVDCSETFYYYIVLVTIGKLIASTSLSANMVIGFRCIEERDKTVASGLRAFGYHFFTAIPFAIVFGAIADAACLIWGESCGSQGNCWFYDADKFRILLHGTASIFMTIGSFFDLFVIYFSSRIENLYDDEHVEDFTNVGCEKEMEMSETKQHISC